MASSLRADLEAALKVRQSNIRVGRREGDVIPKEKGMEGGFRKLIEGREINQKTRNDLKVEAEWQRKNDWNSTARLTEILMKLKSALTVSLLNFITW